MKITPTSPSPVEREEEREGLFSYKDNCEGILDHPTGNLVICHHLLIILSSASQALEQNASQHSNAVGFF
ncbi:MAG: hypothetical protein COZ70_14695 [Deltaproteobacteria bacterium CG_4_8_14_3_um_filter_51_11]|nr:MAG: hypothetical protein AUK25_02355 [Desulfobacteraceae bacterium CG2_30_51_40]PIX18332.1 MAG: hypothetical protein COZ70_14695 [Deltaproteobacteria bacterium CG_4_8_14_3_um_filter_51_11]PIY26414.1 MAG: hypothetical protein COZ11_02680 [Deltaproteobacteria bacterium CG_4_10_14_3_um_filter_51_14]PJB37096.1 MAG: hypothetical protein CO107_05825 [Deltaproteobacteria bacterium CG_4_9_14_3_um_filter_51_14]